MRIQMSFDGPIPLDELEVRVEAFDPLGAVAVETGRGGPDAVGLQTYFIDFEIRPNPDWEKISPQTRYAPTPPK